MAITVRWMCAFRNSSKTISDMIIREHGNGSREVAAETIVNGTQIKGARIGVEIPSERIRRKFGQDVWSSTNGAEFQLHPKRNIFWERSRGRMAFDAYNHKHTESFCTPGEIKSVVINCGFEELTKHERAEIKIALRATKLPLKQLRMAGKKAILVEVNLPKNWL